MKPLNAVDEKIIQLMQVNNRLTFAEIAAKVGLSASSCRRRIDALRQAKVIVADVSIINPAILGARLTIVTLVVLERETPSVHAGFKRSMKALPEVTHCYLVAGRCDYLLHISVRSMEQYDALCERIFTANSVVKRIDSLVVMKKVKEPGLP